jgi:quinol monooxygenase YgiN
VVATGKPATASASMRVSMSDAIVYLDVSDVREGALEALKTGMKELVDFVEAEEPRILAYNVYFSDDGARMTVVGVYPDSAALEYHMQVAGPVFRRFVELLTLSSIHIYGDPSEKVLERSREKARLLGRGDVEVAALRAGFGFTRFPIP